MQRPEGVLMDRLGRSYELLSSGRAPLSVGVSPLELSDPTVARQFLIGFDLSLARWLIFLGNTSISLPPAVAVSESKLLTHLSCYIALGQVKIFPFHGKSTAPKTYSDGVWAYRFSRGPNSASGSDMKVAIESEADAEALLKKLKGGANLYASILRENGYEALVNSQDLGANQTAVKKLLTEQKLQLHKVSRIAASKPESPEILPPQGPGNRPVPLAAKDKQNRTHWFCIKLKDEHDVLVKQAKLEMKLTDGKEDAIAIGGGFHKSGSTLPAGNCQVKSMEWGDDSEAYIFESIATE